MKQFFTVTFLVALAVLLIAPSLLMASDTLTVYASGPTLDKVILSDTAGNGSKLHHVYKLVTTDTVYIFDGTITTSENFTLWGVPNALTGKLPCIQPDVLQDNSIPGVLFTFTGHSTKATLANVYLLGISVGNTINYGSGQAVQISGDSIKFVANNVIFEQWSQFAIGYAANWDKFWITNCKFRNMTTLPTQWYVGEVIRNENYIGAFPTDTIIFKYNTMLGVSGYATAATGGIVHDYEFSHNDVILTFKNPFFLDRMVNAKFDNNIFYDAYAGGENKTEYGGWDSFTANTGPSLITLGPLDSLTAARLLGHAITTAQDTAAAEAARNIEVKNNVYFWSAKLVNFLTAWNDTAHSDSIYTATWMNASTMAMFNTPAKWPGFVQSGNQNIDPGFGASIAGVTDSNGGNGVGLLNWLTAVRNASGSTQTYGYKLTVVGSSITWTPTWPLPETNDLVYSDVALKTGGTDGLAVGDPYWIIGTVTGVKAKNSELPTKFALKPVYPNPFNPSTNIQYSLNKSGLVSLKIYNVLGQLVKTVYDNVNQAPNTYTVRVDMSDFTSGVYMTVLQQGSNRLVQKMMLVK
jgi:hypothetical protein